MENPSSASAGSENYRFSLPQGWIFDNGAPVPTMACPEGDLHVSFVELESAGTVQATAVAAWRKLDPAFDTVVLQEYPAASTQAWDTHTKSCSQPQPVNPDFKWPLLGPSALALT